MQRFLKLLIASFAIAVLSGCTHFVHSEKWTARPTQKIEQISIIWVSNASGDWDGASSSRNLGATSFSGAGIPPVANEVDYGKIGEHFKSQGTALLKLQGFSGRVEATDSQKEMLKIIQTSNSEKYWLGVWAAEQFEAVAVNRF